MNKIKTIFVVAIFTIFVCECSRKDEESTSNQKAKENKIIKLEKTYDSITISLLGSVIPKTKAEVSSKIIGRIEKLYYDEGDRVTKGSKLAKVETLSLEIQLKKDEASREVQSKQIDIAKARLQLAKQKVEKDLVSIQKAEAELNDAEANLNNLKRTYTNKKELFEIGGVSESELKAVETALVSSETNFFKSKKTLDTLRIGFREEDVKKANITFGKNKQSLNEAIIKLNTLMEEAELAMAIANLKATIANIESTKLLINESILLSPINGIVASRNLFQGESAKEGEPVFIIVDESELFITFPVNESELSLIKTGDKIKFTIDAIKNREFEGKIQIVSPILDPQSRSASIKIFFNNLEKKLKPGMFARAEYNIKQGDESFYLPLNAIIPSKDGDKGDIFVLNENSLAFKKPISIIEVLEDKVKIATDLPEGTRVIVGDLKSITDGQSFENE
ncbi:MAG: efflux RND transporter periplasmic adaptor subunit [Leptospira sp.]|nr:efflux RND transporter periplasmic adaptor subunit [Leptospira sp.]